MSYFTEDPMETIIVDRRINPNPVYHFDPPEILTVDLDLMASSLQRNLERLFLYDHRVMKLYNVCSSIDTVNQQITSDITAMVNYAIGCTYNHLRAILQSMETECPVPNEMEFPAWVSSTLGSIGPCRIVKGPRPRNATVLYASAATCMENYGRKTLPVFDENSWGTYLRLLRVLNDLGVATSRFPLASSRDRIRIATSNWLGSYFPMIKPKLEEHTWSYYGYVDECHYENEDVARIALVTSEDGVTPFEPFGFMKPIGGECYYQSQLVEFIHSNQVFHLLHYRIMGGARQFI